MLKIAIILIIIIIIILIIWRFASIYHLLPCPTWLSWCVEGDNPFAPVHKAQAIVQNADVHQGMSVLDVGCGPGRVTIPLAEAVGPTGEVVAMDVQLGMIEKTKQKAARLGLTNIKYIQGEVSEYGLGENKFDRIILVAVLGEIPNQISALKTIFKALKPKGILSITEIIFDPHFQTSKKVIGLALPLGFIQKQIIGKWFAYTINFEKRQDGVVSAKAGIQ